jgi:hypothetical protein
LEKSGAKNFFYAGVEGFLVLGLSPAAAMPGNRKNKSFLVLFFKKEPLFH